MTVKTWFVAAVSAACVFALGCGGGESDSRTCETPDGRISFGQYLLLNDSSANSDLPAEEQVTDHHMCSNVASGTAQRVNTFWEWGWPAGSTVRLRATPRIVYGFHPWEAASTTSALPVLVSDVGSLTVWAAVTQRVGTSQRSDFGVVLYLTTSDQRTGTDPLPVAKQLLVLRNRYGATTETPTATGIALSGMSWDVIVSDTEVLYYPHANAGERADTLELELEDFLQDAVTRDAIEPTWFVASVETGARVFQGTGELALTDYQVHLTAAE
ncbi:MAG TPA: hypothetical protein VEB43_16380 [Anaeromyxobacter sp.]|nr:hypothetical protein [Anaeromyxobacter sp.]